MDALRRRVSHGWLTEPGSNPRTGTASIRKPRTKPLQDQNLSGFSSRGEPKSCRVRRFLPTNTCGMPLAPRLANPKTGGAMPAVDFHPPQRDWRIVALASVALMLIAAGASSRVEAREPQPLESIAEAAIAALGAGDAQSAEAVLAPSLRLARCGQPLQAVATG